ncbi:hypothetical protein PSTT_13719 [Puccinia striiformis]|uniref:Uncharacterized protein n=1 Tax=Puccinia striiformis TaxID=27350 RepID=A0A2S4UR18_9BASI|nr:hypothetical protein PSTT_13719 [Puccinia striiformis]
MSSEQIQSLAQSIRNVTRDLVELVALFQTADQEMIDDRAELSQGFLDIGTSLKSRFDPPLRVILIYLLPIIPETHLGYLNQNYYKDWGETRWLVACRTSVDYSIVSIATSVRNWKGIM